MYLCKNKVGVRDVYPVEGDVIHLHTMGKSFVVLNSARAATELLDKRSYNYSERPHFPVFELFLFPLSCKILSTDPLVPQNGLGTKSNPIVTWETVSAA